MRLEFDHQLRDGAIRLVDDQRCQDRHAAPVDSWPSSARYAGSETISASYLRIQPFDARYADAEALRDRLAKLPGSPRGHDSFTKVH